jgi:hypothetical protein
MAKIVPVNKTIQHFIELERKKEEVKKYFEELSAATQAVAEEFGTEVFFQDPTDNTVYQIVVPEGKFVSFDKFGYVRTKREGEARGSLSVKKAQEAGFDV